MHLSGNPLATGPRLAVAGLCLSLLVGFFAVATFPAVADDGSIEGLVIDSGTTVLTLNFNDPISPAEAINVADDLAEAGDQVSFSVDEPTVAVAKEAATSREATTAAVAAKASRPPLGCGNQLVETDSRGRFTLDHRCDLSPHRMQWTYKLSSAVASIVVGLVSEKGAQWWKNGTSMPRNAPHTVGATYIYHGTFNPVVNGNGLDYQDVMTFRHKVGTGGTGSVVWAGSIQATRTLP